MKVRCYSVRLQSLTEITEKCLKATDWGGKTALVPKSQYHGRDYDVQKSDAFWISAWLIEKEDFDLLVSMKKEAWFDSETGKMLPTFIIEKHKPEKINPQNINYDKNLER